MLRIVNLSAGDFKDINLEVAPNQIIAITGDNGSGKSTLAKVIAGYYQSNSSAINISPADIGLLLQNPFLQFIGNTVFDELTYSLEQAKQPISSIESILAKSPCRLDQSLAKLSGGEAQRLLIYKELCTDKRLLILDETLSNLDQVQKEAVVTQLRTSDKAIILITNNLNDTSFADRVYQLQNKQLVEVENQIHDIDLIDNNNPVSLEYGDYKFRAGLNIITGSSASGKSRLVNELCFTIGSNISLIPQYPFEMITTSTAIHLQSSPHRKLLGLTDVIIGQNITELSTGELVKVQIAEALQQGNSHIVLDESIEVLDRNSQAMVLDLLTANFETIIIVTHNKYLFNKRQVFVVEVK